MDWKLIETATEADLPFIASHLNDVTGETCGYHLIVGLNIRSISQNRVWRGWVDNKGESHAAKSSDEKQDGSIGNLTHWSPLRPIPYP